MVDPVSHRLMMAAGDSVPSLDYIANYTGSGGGTGNVTASFGTASTDRVVLALIWLSNGASSSISGVTIGGVSATTTVTFNSGYQAMLLAQVALPTGTSGTIAWTGSNGPDFYAVGVWTLKNYRSSTAIYTNNYSSGASTDNSNTFSLTNIPPGSVGVFAEGTWGSGPGTWTNVTENFNYNPQGGLTAGRLNANVSGNFDVTATISAPEVYFTMIGAVWR